MPHPESYARAPSPPGILPASLVELLHARVRTQSEAVACAFVRSGDVEEARWTYADLADRANAVAGWLTAEGLRGSRALLLHPPGLEFVAAFLGCLAAGVVAVPLSPPRPNRSARRLVAVMADARPACALATRGVMEGLDAVLDVAPELRSLAWGATETLPSCEKLRGPLPRPGDLALLQYTSGSTGSPRGVMVTHSNLMHNARILAEEWSCNPSAMVSWLPFFHDMGLITAVVLPLYAGFPCHYLAPLDFVQDPLLWLRTIAATRATIAGAPNFAYDLCARKVAAGCPVPDLSTWKVAFCGSEPIHAATMERFARTVASSGFRRSALYAGYGLAESTLLVSGEYFGPETVCSFDAAALGRSRAQLLPANGPGGRALVAHGKGVPGQRWAIVDPVTSSACGETEVGELWVSGPCVARGYFEREEESAATFRARIAPDDGTEYLRTGDLAFLHGGRLFLAGRIKDLIVVRGRNVYPQDLESTATACHPALAGGAAAAFAVEHGGEEQVVLLHEVDRHCDDLQGVLAAIRRAIVEEHEVEPHGIVLLRPASLLKTTSGKIQRRDCRRAYEAGEFRVLARWTRPEEDPVPRAAPAAPSPAGVREWLAAELARFVPPSGVPNDDPSLLEIAADSLALVGLTHRIESTFGVCVPLAELLAGPTVRELVELIAKAPRAAAPEAARTERPARPSFGQESLWFLQELAPQSAAYNIPVAARLRGPLDADALHAAFVHLVRRHAALRTTFPAIDGRPEARVAAEPAFGYECRDAGAVSDALVQQRLVDEARRPFDLAAGPLLRVHVWQRGPEESVLLLVVHHGIADYWSLARMIGEVAAAYTALRGGREPPALPPLPREAQDHAREQRRWLASSAGQEQLRYWTRHLAAPLPVLALPVSRPRPPVLGDRGGVRRARLAPEGTAALHALARRARCTPYTVTLAAFQALLCRLTGQEDVVLGTLHAGRSSAALAEVVGYFVNPLVLRTQLGGNPRFADLLQRTRTTVLEAFAHADVPFAALVDALAPPRDASRTPLFQVLFLWQNTHPLGSEALAPFALGQEGGRLPLGDLVLESLEVEQTVAQFDLCLVFAPLGDELRIALEYHEDLFDPELAGRLLEAYATLLAAVLDRPEQRLLELPCLPPAERERVLSAAAPAQAAAPAPPQFLERFEAQVLARPGALAVVSADERVPYHALAARAHGIAQRLRAGGLCAEDCVAVWMDRGPGLVATLLGIWEAGGAALLLDVQDPPGRVRAAVAESGARLLLTSRRWQEGAAAVAGAARLLHVDEDAVPPCSTALPLPARDTLASVTFTSGSTGTPKGVLVTHAALASTCAAWGDAYALDESFVHLQMARACFDVFTGDVLRALAFGGTLVVCPRDVLLSPPELRDLIVKERVNAAEFVPAILGALVQFLEERQEGLDGFRLLIAGSDTWSAADARRVRARVGPRTRVFNSYGVTECTIDSLCHELGDPAAPDSSGTEGTVPLGRPLTSTGVLVLDAGLMPVPDGVPGELFLAGPLARGYCQRPDATAERFVPDPFGPAGGRLYRTGDRVRRRPDGVVEFLGRADSQVKLAGVRLELGEVRAALHRHPAVAAAEVVVHTSASGVRQLAAYLVAKEPLEAPVLRRFLQQWLPDPAIPATFQFLDALPLSANGKVDRARLPAPAAPAASAAPEPPRTAAQTLLHGIFREVLGRDGIGIHDNFFEIGGDSIRSIQIVARARALGLPLAARDVFQHQSIAALARAAEEMPRDTAAAPLAPEPRAPVLALDRRARARIAELLERADRDAP